MGACASKKAYQSTSSGEELSAEALSKSHLGYRDGVSVSRQGVRGAAESGKRSTAEVISSTILSQADAEPQSMRGFAARLASKLGAEGKRASAQAAHMRIGSAPAAEAFASSPPGSAKEFSARGAPAVVGAALDSFEMSREETMKRLSLLQNNFDGDSGTPTWAVAVRKPGGDSSTADADAMLSYEADARSSNQSDGRGSAGGRRTSNGSGRRWSIGAIGTAREVELEDALSKVVEEQEEVVPVGEDVGERQEAATAALKRASAAAAARAVAAARASKSQDGAEGWDWAESALHTGLGRDGSFRQAGLTSTRDDGPFNTVSISKMQGSGPVAAAIAAAAAGGSAAEGAGGAAAAANATTDVQGETDELASLPLPNLISRAGDTKRTSGAGSAGGSIGGGRAPRTPTGQRHSAASYLQQAAIEPQVSTPPAGGGACRNSDLGYYLEESRLTTPVLQGSRAVVRRNLMDSPLARLREEAAAREAAAVNKAPIVLDYVPALKSQPSRNNLLAMSPLVQKPSVQRHLLHGGGGSGGGPLDDDDDDNDLSMSRRLDYMPNRSLSRKFSQANLAASTSLLLGAGSCSRPLSRVNSRTNVACASPRGLDGFPGSPRGTGAGESDRCFHVTRTAASMLAAGTSMASNVSLCGGTSGMGMAGLASNGGAALAVGAGGPQSALVGHGRRRRGGGGGGGDDDDAQSCTSASQVHFGPILAVPVAAAAAASPLAALRSAGSQELSWRPSRAAAVAPSPEPRVSTPQLLASPGVPSRLHVRRGMANDPSDPSGSSRPVTMHGSPAWTGPRGQMTSAASAVSSPGLSAPAPLAAPALSASTVSRRGLGVGLASTDMATVDMAGSGSLVIGPIGSGAGGGPGDPRVITSFSIGGGGSRAAGRAARLLATIQRMGGGPPEAAAT